MLAAKTFWFFGLSGAGKSTLADSFHQVLVANAVLSRRLDGDVLRKGLNSDLGFSAVDRSENIRRAAEVARLFNDTGVTVVASFISPRRIDRDAARAIVGPRRWIDVFVDAPLPVCEARDPKGLYRQARAGHLTGLTGVSAPFEPAHEACLRIDTASSSVDDAVALLRRMLMPRV